MQYPEITTIECHLHNLLLDLSGPPWISWIKATLTDSLIEQVVTQQELQLQPIDLLYLLETDRQQTMNELDEHVLLQIIQTVSPRPDALISIQYIERLTDKISFFELTPLGQNLRSLALRSRPLNATDIALHNAATKAQKVLSRWLIGKETAYRFCCLSRYYLDIIMVSL